MIVLILFTICQFTLLIMNHMLFQGIPSAWNQIGIPVVAISFFTEAVLVINSYRNSKNKVLEQKKERLEHELNRMKMEEESAEVQAERLNKRREDLLRIVKEAENDLHTEDRGSAAAKLQKEIEKNQAGQYCSNMILNVLLEEYEIRCQKVKIRLSVDAHVGELPGISRIHQCSILSNLMNNAMEAVEYLPESEMDPDRYPCEGRLSRDCCGKSVCGEVSRNGKRRRARIWQQDPSGDRKDVWRKLQCEDRQGEKDI